MLLPLPDSTFHFDRRCRIQVKQAIAAQNTTTLPPSASRSEVFETAELFENILIHLPFEDLIVIQRVSRKFRDAIQRSPSIQTKLFLRPIPKTKHLKEVERQSASGITLAHADQDDGCVAYVAAKPNPLVGTAEDWHCVSYIDVEPEYDLEGEISAGNTFGSLLRDKMSYGGGTYYSWEKMFICNPPPRKVIIKLDDQSLFSIQSSNGVTLGALASVIQHRDDFRRFVRLAKRYCQEEEGDDVVYCECHFVIPEYFFPTEEEWQAICGSGVDMG